MTIPILKSIIKNRGDVNSNEIKNKYIEISWFVWIKRDGY